MLCVVVEMEDLVGVLVICGGGRWERMTDGWLGGPGDDGYM